MPVIRPDLLPNTEKSQKLVRLIRDCFNMSSHTVSQNFSVWDRLEQQYRAYRPKDSEDIESLKKNNVQKIIVPIQFATMQTMLTFMMEVFTALKPVLRVRGADPASRKKARIVETALDYDYRGNRGFFSFYQWFMNAYRYGYGVVQNSWGVKQTLKRTLRPGPPGIISLEGQEFNVPGDLEYDNEWFTTFEGNKWRIVDNRYWFPDPRISLSRFQDGQFCGEQDRLHFHDLISYEDQGLVFNIRELRRPSAGVREADFFSNDNQRSRVSVNYLVESISQAKRDKMHVIEQIIIKLIPKEWELSDEDRPESWLFWVADGRTIIRAEPSPFLRFPYEIVEAYPDELAFMSQGMMELTEPLSQHLNFLFNSHMANVRKAINDMLLIDPSRVDVRDLLDPAAGKVIRLLPNAYGTDVGQAVKQLNVVDVTRGHIEDSKSLLDLWMRITGVSDALFGQISASRRTAFELQGVFKMSASRMKLQADLFSSEGVAPLTEQMVVLRQENMTMEQFLEVAGQTALDLGVDPKEIINGSAFIRANQSHFDGIFQYPAEEGVLPQDRASAAQILQEVFKTVAQAPFLSQVFDPVAIFREMIRQSGYHNIDEFMNRGIRPDVRFMSQQQIAEAVSAGQIVPFDIEGGGTPGRPDEGVRDSRIGLTLDGLLNGAGRTRDQRTIQS